MLLFYIGCTNDTKINEQLGSAESGDTSQYYPEKKGSLNMYAGICYFSVLDTTYLDTIEVYRQSHDSLRFLTKQLMLDKLTNEFFFDVGEWRFKLNASQRYNSEAKSSGFKAQSQIEFKSIDSMRIISKSMDYDYPDKSDFRIFIGKLIK